MNALLSYLGLLWLRIMGDKAIEKSSGSEVAPVSEVQPESTWSTPPPVEYPSGIQTADTGTEQSLIPSSQDYPSIQDRLNTDSGDSTDDDSTINNSDTESEANNDQNEQDEGQSENESTKIEPPETLQPESSETDTESAVTAPEENESVEGQENKPLAEEISTESLDQTQSPTNVSSGAPEENKDSSLSDQQSTQNKSETQVQLDTSTKPTASPAGQTNVNITATNATANSTDSDAKKVESPVTKTIEQEVDDFEQTLIKDYQIFSKIFILVALVVLVIGYTIAITYYFNTYLWNEIKNAILNGYQEFIEKQVPSKKLRPSQIIYLSNYTWKSQDEKSLDCIQSETNFEGQIFKIEYKKTESELFFSPMAIRESELKNQMVFYYEIEISYLYDQGKLVIGFMELENQDQAMPKLSPGKFANSIGFNVRTGEIYQNNEIAHVFKYQEIIQEFADANQSGMLDLTGCFFGIGVNLHLKKFFFTFNGSVLNTLSYQAMTEIRYKDFDMRRKDLISEAEGIRGKDNMNQYSRKLQIKKEFRDEIKGLKDFKCAIKSLTPVIFMEKLCRISVNVGGSPFQLRDRELKHGLLLGEWSLCINANLKVQKIL